MQNKTLRRSATNQVLAGVCGGIGEYFAIDPTLVRVIFILLAFATGSGILLYIILWLIIPGAASTAQSAGETTMKEGFQEMETKFNEVKDKVQGEYTNNPQVQQVKNDGPNWLGIFLILLGGWFFLSNFGFFRLIDFDKFWPLLIILLGIFVLVKRK